MHENQDAKFLTGFAIGAIGGAIAGAATALLLAPQSGLETRLKLKEAADGYAARGREGYDRVRAQAQTEAGTVVEDIDLLKRYNKLSPEGKVEFKRQITAMLSEQDAAAIEEALDEVEEEEEATEVADTTSRRSRRNS